MLALHVRVHHFVPNPGHPSGHDPGNRATPSGPDGHGNPGKENPREEDRGDLKELNVPDGEPECGFHPDCPTGFQLVGNQVPEKQGRKALKAKTLGIKKSGMWSREPRVPCPAGRARGVHPRRIRQGMRGERRTPGKRRSILRQDLQPGGREA